MLAYVRTEEPPRGGEGQQGAMSWGGERGLESSPLNRAARPRRQEHHGPPPSPAMAPPSWPSTSRTSPPTGSYLSFSPSSPSLIPTDPQLYFCKFILLMPTRCLTKILHGRLIHVLSFLCYLLSIFFWNSSQINHSNSSCRSSRLLVWCTCLYWTTTEWTTFVLGFGKFPQYTVGGWLATKDREADPSMAPSPAFSPLGGRP
jgi:hypothetical protein